MTTLRIRGLDAKALDELKARATNESTSVNRLVLRLIEEGLGNRQVKHTLTRHDDLDALAGSWQQREGAGFERTTSAFGKVDPQLWK